MVRMTADERRQAIIEAATIEFGAGGLDGTNVDSIARRVGVTQPYVFRLFGTKKALFLACVEVCFAETHDAFESAAAGLSGEEALRAMGRAYSELIKDRSRLKLQLQSYAACDDPTSAASFASRYGELVEFVEARCGPRHRARQRVLRHGDDAERPRGGRPARCQRRLGRPDAPRVRHRAVSSSFSFHPRCS